MRPISSARLATAVAVSALAGATPADPGRGGEVMREDADIIEALRDR